MPNLRLSSLAVSAALACPVNAAECMTEPVAGDPDNAAYCVSNERFNSFPEFPDDDFDGLLAMDFTVSPAQCGRIGFSLFTGWSGHFGETGPIPPGESRRVEFAEALLLEETPTVLVWFYDPPCGDGPGRVWDATIDVVLIDD